MDTLQSELGPEPDRLIFIDHLRMALIALVVLHHLSVIYAANVGFYYVEPTTNVGAIVILAFFQLFNQAFFMGLFFFLAGYFTPSSFDRKGPGNFIKDRAIRLGVPLLIYIFVLNPLASIGVYQMPSSLTGITTPFVWYEHFSTGPMWFIVMLLIFCAVYLLWRVVTKSRAKTQSAGVPVPKFWKILLFVVILAAVSYLVRIGAPIAITFLIFPSLAYLPQYASFFAIGIVANRNNWLRAIPDKLGKSGLIVALLSIILFLIGMSARLGSGSAFIGGGTFQSGVYALFDSLFAVGWSLFLITFFRRRFDRKMIFGSELMKSSFAVYVIHCPIIVLMAVLLQNLHIMQLAKFGLMAVICVPICFAAAYLIRRIPYPWKRSSVQE